MNLKRIVTKFKNKITLPLLIIIAAFIAILCIILIITGNEYEDLVDNETYESLQLDLETAAENFDDNGDYCDYLESFAKNADLTYTRYDSGNIVIELKGTDSSLNDTIICTYYNVNTFSETEYSILSCLYIALYIEPDCTTRLVFMDEDWSYSDGTYNLDEELFTDDANVIYLSDSSNSSITTSSFARAISKITIPFDTEDVTCDTAITITLTGLTSENYIDQSTPNPLAQVCNVLTRFKNKSITSQVTNIEIINDGYPYPTGVTMTVMINSYDLDTVTTYLDNRISDFLDDYEENFPEVSFTYEIWDEDSTLPETAYSSETTEILVNVLYTIQTGNYRFAEGDDIPEGYEEKDVYATNRVKNFSIGSSSITLTLETAALNSDYLEMILNENSTAASLAEATCTTSHLEDAFLNEDSELAATISDLYIDANDLISSDSILSETTSKYFTPCSTIASINDSLDIIHISLSEGTNTLILNALMNYLATQPV